MNIFNTKFFDNIYNFMEKWYYIFFSIILIIASLNLFYNLGRVPIWSWDEARHGVNAYEMMKRSNYVINTYGYVNDYWNLKPPVSYWAIVAGYKIAGFNPLGLRVFSALAALLNIAVIGLFTFYKYGRLASLIASSTLTTTMPFIIEHCGRTGDADSIFILFFTLAVISISLTNNSVNWLYVAGLAFALAFLTKSWHAGCIVVIYGFYLILSRTIFKLKFHQILLFILSTAIPILLWGYFRYKQDGFVFFKTMIEYDLLARTSSVLEGHIGNASFYIEMLQRSYFYWLLVLVSTILSLTLILQPKQLNIKSVNSGLVLLLWIAIPFLLYTKAKTKIAWYILPIFPAMAISVGAASSYLLKCKNRNLVFQFLLSFMILFSSYKNEVSIKNLVVNPGENYTQSLLMEVGKLAQYRGKNIYTIFKSESADNPDRWEQSYLLCAELYGDMVPIEGGLDEFLRDKTNSPLILIPKNVEGMSEIERYSFKIVAENEVACILTK